MKCINIIILEWAQMDMLMLLQQGEALPAKAVDADMQTYADL